MYNFSAQEKKNQLQRVSEKVIVLIGNSFTSRRVEQLKPHDIERIKAEEGRDSIVVVDVREEWEFYGDMGHVKNSILVPMEELPEKIDFFKSLNGKKIALMCNSGQRSYFAAGFLKDNGVNDVYNVYGGIIQWHLSGLEVEYD